MFTGRISSRVSRALVQAAAFGKPHNARNAQKGQFTDITLLQHISLSTFRAFDVFSSFISLSLSLSVVSEYGGEFLDSSDLLTHSTNYYHHSRTNVSSGKQGEREREREIRDNQRIET